VVGQAKTSGSSWWADATREVGVEAAQGVLGKALEKPLLAKTFQRSVNTGVGHLFFTARHSSLVRGRIAKYFEPAHGSSYLVGKANVWVSKEVVQPLGGGVYYDWATREYFGLFHTAKYGEGKLVKDLDVVYSARYEVREIAEDTLGKWTARNVGIPFLIDFGFQLAEDSTNPRLTPELKLKRAAISGGVGVFGGGVAYVLVKGTCLLVGISTPAGWMFLVGGVLVGVAFENPFSHRLHERFAPERPLNLQPLP
jgi:hypothetical protein